MAWLTKTKKQISKPLHATMLMDAHIEAVRCASVNDPWLCSTSTRPRDSAGGAGTSCVHMQVDASSRNHHGLSIAIPTADLELDTAIDCGLLSGLFKSFAADPTTAAADSSRATNRRPSIASTALSLRTLLRASFSNSPPVSPTRTRAVRSPIVAKELMLARLEEDLQALGSRRKDGSFDSIDADMARPLSPPASDQGDTDSDIYGDPDGQALACSDVFGLETAYRLGPGRHNGAAGHDDDTYDGFEDGAAGHDDDTYDDGFEDASDPACAAAEASEGRAANTWGLDGSVDGGGAHWETPLMLAAAHGLTNEVKLLLQQEAVKANLAAADSHGTTALIYAAIHHQEAVVTQLIKHTDATQIAWQDHSGRTAFHWACALGSAACADLLLTACRSMAFIEAGDGNTPLHTAVRERHDDVVDVILELLSSNQSKRLLATTNADGLTPVELARSTGSSTVCETLARVALAGGVKREHEGHGTTPSPCGGSHKRKAVHDEPGEGGRGMDVMSASGGLSSREKSRNKKNKQMREVRKMRSEDEKHSKEQVQQLAARNQTLAEALATMRAEAAQLRAQALNVCETQN